MTYTQYLRQAISLQASMKLCRHLAKLALLNQMQIAYDHNSKCDKISCTAFWN